MSTAAIIFTIFYHYTLTLSLPFLDHFSSFPNGNIPNIPKITVTGPQSQSNRRFESTTTSTGGHQLSHAMLLWHLLVIDGHGGNVELAMALGYRHLYSASNGSKLVLDLIADDKIILTRYVVAIFVCLMLRYIQWSCLAKGSRVDNSRLSFMRQCEIFHTDMDSSNITIATYYLGTPV